MTDIGECVDIAILTAISHPERTTTSTRFMSVSMRYIAGRVRDGLLTRMPSASTAVLLVAYYY
jgi:hypothetical protein